MIRYLLVPILTCCALILSCCSTTPPYHPPQDARSLNRSFSDFSLTDLRGKQLNLADQRGKFVLLHFFASWCKPCKQEMRELAKLGRDYEAANFSIISLAVMDSTLSVISMLEGEEINFPIAIDRRGAIFSPFKRHGIPSTVLLGPRGNLHQLLDPQSNKLSSIVSGPRNWNSTNFKAFIKTLNDTH